MNAECAVACCFKGSSTDGKCQVWIAGEGERFLESVVLSLFGLAVSSYCRGGSAGPNALRVVIGNNYDMILVMSKLFQTKLPLHTPSSKKRGQIPVFMQ